MSPKPPFGLLVLVTLSGTMALHMLVPALPGVAAGLGVQAGEVQHAISIYIVGLAVGQLFYGPLSDARGRRPMLLWGLGLYALGGAASAFAVNLPMLLAARFAQALGGCAGMALGRAMVRDSSDADTAIGQLALLNLCILLGPALAPMVGGAVAGSLGWRAVLLLLTAVGAVTLWLAWRSVPETGRPSGRVDTRTLLDQARELLHSRRFVCLAVGGGSVAMSTYGFLASAPFILTRQLGEPVEAVGFYSGVVILGAGAGNVVTRWWIRHAPGERIFFAGAALGTVAAVILLALALSHRLATVHLVVLMLVFTCGVGMSSTVSMALAIGVKPHLIGSAAGLYGFTQMSMGAIISALATLGNDPALTMGYLLVGAMVFGLLVSVLALRETDG